jgi:poly-gamma-glutamate synthesis protein (capsule biosynthesis protein)
VRPRAQAALLALATVASLTTPRSTADAQPRAASAPAVTLTIALGGDVIFDAPVEYVLRARGSREDDPLAYAELFEDVRAPLDRADLAIVNLETPVGPRVRSRSEERDYPTFAAPPAFLAALRAAGVDVVTVANNHAYDQGVAGLATTLEHARALGLHAAGAVGEGLRAHTISIVRGVRVATVALTQGTNHRAEREEPSSPRVAFFDPERLVRLVSAARQEADVVIVALHFTDTGDHLPTGGMERWARRAAEAGADLVVGHGPHLPARVDWVDVGGRRVPLLHSLGNLVAAMRAEEHAERSREVHVRDALVIEATVRVEGGRVRVESLRPHAFWIDDARAPEGLAPFTRPLSIEREVVRASRDRGEALRRRGERLAGLLGGPAPALASHPSPSTLASVVSLAPPSPTRAPSGATPSPPPPSPAPAPPRPASVPATPPPATPPPATGRALGVSFRCGSASESAVDEAALDAWVARMRREPALRLEIVAERCEGESPAMAERRARRASGLLAVRGPSRSRLAHRAGGLAQDAAPRVEALAVTPR